VEFKDYYRVMELDETATPESIKKAYKKLARRYHPDVSKEPDAETKFKELGEAYEVLGDPGKRREYDQLRAVGDIDANGRFRPRPGWAGAQGPGRQYSEADFSDFFSSMFGSRGFQDADAGAAAGPRRGEDVHYELALLLEEVFHGCEQVVELRIPKVDAQGRRTIAARKLRIKVPAGMTDGSVLRVNGQGAPGMGGGSAGDLLVTIRLAAHPLYAVDGKHVSLIAPVAPWEAALGCKLVMPTLGGKARVVVPAQSQTGQKLRLAGKGLPGTPPGDFFVVLKVVMPGTLSDKARDLYRQLELEAGFNPRQSWEKGQ
jgi:curved DNA-binding protein